MILTILGLALFEIISSVDNAIINAQVLHTMTPKARKWFLGFGIIFAVFVVRGLLPLILVWLANPSLGFSGALTATFSGDPSIIGAIHKAEPLLLAGAGVFLLFLFFHWLFMEEKNFGLPGERFFSRQGVWFYAVISLLLLILVRLAMEKDPFMAFSAVVGSTAFFITHGFKQYAEMQEKKLLNSTRSDINKIMYLEIIDSTFSVDGVLGAFAFTLSVPLILLGNGIGALIVRQITVRNVQNIQKYKYIKNGAMYSILFLSLVMLLESFGVEIPTIVSPIITFLVVGYFFLKSKKEL